MLDAGAGVEFCPNCGAAATGASFCPKCGRDLRSEPATGGQPLAPRVPTGATDALKWSGAVVLIGGCLAVLGSFLPWISATAAFVGTISRSGLDGGGDGIITIGAGIIIALHGIALLIRKSGNARAVRASAVVFALVLGAVAVLDINSVNERVATVNSSAALASLGMGLVLVGLAAVVTVIGAFLPAVRKRGDP